MEPSSTTTGTVKAAPSNTSEPPRVAVTAIVSLVPSCTLPLSTLKSTVSAVSPSSIVNEAPFTVNEPDAPLTASTSVSPAVLSSTVVSENAPDLEPAPAPIVTSNVSSPSGIE